MPDPGTHILVPLSIIRLIEIVKRKSIINSQLRYLFCLGCIFPDLLDKGIPYSFHYLLKSLVSFGIISKNHIYIPTFQFLHTPLILLFCLYLFCLLFHETHRRRIFYWTGMGIITHLIMDSVQGNICDIGYLWFFPFSFEAPEFFNLFYEDRSVQLLPLFLMIYILVETRFRRL